MKIERGEGGALLAFVLLDRRPLRSRKRRRESTCAKKGKKCPKAYPHSAPVLVRKKGGETKKAVKKGGREAKEEKS